MYLSSSEEEGDDSIEVSQRLAAFAYTAKVGEISEWKSKGLSTPVVLGQDIMCVKTGLVLLCGSNIIFIKPLAACRGPGLTTAVLVTVCVGTMGQSFGQRTPGPWATRSHG